MNRQIKGLTRNLPVSFIPVQRDGGIMLSQYVPVNCMPISHLVGVPSKVAFALNFHPFLSHLPMDARKH